MSTIRRVDASSGREPLFGVAATRRIEAQGLRDAPAFTLMTRAGDAVARLALALAPHAERVLILAGPGNNGGDGLEAATRLRALGKDASVVLLGDPAALPADAGQAHARARQAGVPVSPWPPASHDAPDLVIDALLGIGASRPPAGDLAAAIALVARHAARGVPVLAVDVPSGLDPERGQPLGEACVVAEHTLALIGARPGLFTASGRDFAGTVWTDALGLDLAPQTPDAWLVGTGEIARHAIHRRHAEHKGSFGDVAIVGGAAGMTGAALLAARAAHAAGAGRVFVDLLDADVPALALDPERPELMLRPRWCQGPAAAVEMSTVVCGCGGGDAVRAALPRLVGLASRLVLDADALNALAVDTALRTVLAARASRDRATILTPHPLEAARLLGTTTQAVQADRLGSATALADRYRATVVLKGSGSVIATPGEAPRICATGNASLATGGTGDVLAGWIGGRWRPGASAFDTATLGVVEHGAASEPAQTGALRAADLIERLYRRLREG
ncbi:MAG TPA: NAD(P)H-hydrate dehydratase [Caldimonas sp.]